MDVAETDNPFGDFRLSGELAGKDAVEWLCILFSTLLIH
jgi:hypothetical protein